jgi:putative membrane protein
VRLVKRTCFAVPALLAAVAARAHVAEAGTASGPAIGWSFEPWVVTCLLVAGVLYALGVARVWRRAGVGHGVQPGRVLAFAAGWLLLVVALVSPLDALGGQLFAAHMVQHEVLMVAAAPFCVLGRPLGAWGRGAR